MIPVRKRVLLPWAGVAAVLALATSCQLLVDLDGLEDMHCGPNEKSCPQGCVPKNDPSTGCALLQCGPCAPPHAKAACGNNGECILNGCIPPWDDCNTSYGDGCEIDLAHDANNCKTCGNKCPKPDYGIAGCSNQECTIGGCIPGRENCNDDISDGCERQIWTDEQCMTCNQACPEGTHCAEGVCL